MNLTAELLRELLHYDPETGVFTRIKIVAPNSRIKIGALAGCLNHDGYVRIKIGGRSGRAYNAHRLAWLYMTGRWPEFEIDHADLDTSNNRWSNLREADRSANVANCRRRSDNVSGVKGVCFRKDVGKWQAAICVKGKRIHLGQFVDIKDAQQAYATAAREHFGEFARVA